MIYRYSTRRKKLDQLKEEVRKATGRRFWISI